MLNGIITPLSARTLLTFSCVSLRLFKMLFYSTWQIAELEKRKRVCVGWRGGRSEWNIKSGSDVRFWGALRYYQRITHGILWSGAIWGNSRVRSQRLQRDGWNQSEWVMNGSTVFTWIHHSLVFPASKKKKKIWWFQNCYCCLWLCFSSFGLWRWDHSISKTFRNGWPRNERPPSTRVKCVFAETTAVPHSSCLWLYCTVELWVTCRNEAPFCGCVFLNCSKTARGTRFVKDHGHIF